MLHKLPDGTTLGLHTICAVSPVFRLKAQGSDITQMDSRPRFNVLITGGHQITIVGSVEKEVEEARTDLETEWRMILEGPSMNPEKVN